MLFMFLNHVRLDVGSDLTFMLFNNFVIGRQEVWKPKTIHTGKGTIQTVKELKRQQPYSTTNNHSAWEKKWPKIKRITKKKSFRAYPLPLFQIRRIILKTNGRLRWGTPPH